MGRLQGLLLIFFSVFSYSYAESVIISPADAKKLLEKDPSAILLDVRTEDEYSGGHIKSARLLPYDKITDKTAQAMIPSKQQTVIVYCRSGRRSAIAASALRDLGYTKVFDLGGIQNWPYGLVVK